MTISGVVLNKFPAKQVRTKFGVKDVTEFKLKTAKGIKNCAFWGKLDSGIVNQEVSFEAQHDVKWDKYTVRGTINRETPAEQEPDNEYPAENYNNGGPEGEETEQEENEPPAKPEQPASKSREDYREDAEEAVGKNLKSAEKILKKLKAKATVSETIMIADMVGRTQTAIVLDGKRGN